MRQLEALVVLLFAASSSLAGPALETDEEKFVRLTRQLETQPLADSDRSTRGWLLKWATESKDVSVLICDVLGPIPKQDVPHSGELLLQMLFGNAAFQISHPDRKTDLTATQIAGVRSSMAAYSSIIAKHPDAHIPYFDELLSKETSGALDTFLAPVVADKCSKSAGA
jgi:hypothetical protein